MRVWKNGDMKRRVRVPGIEELPALQGAQLSEFLRKAQPEACYFPPRLA